MRRKDIAQAVALERWLKRVTTDHAERILPVDGPVADQWGRLTARQPGSVIDTLMAATAHVHGLGLVTRNVQDLAWTGVSFSTASNPLRADTSAWPGVGTV